MSIFLKMSRARIIPSIVKKGAYTFDNKNNYSNDKTSIIGVDDCYLLGLLNSSTLDFVLHSIASTKQGGYFEYKPMYVGKLPIRQIDFNNLSGEIPPELGDLTNLEYLWLSNNSLT